MLIDETAILFRLKRENILKSKCVLLQMPNTDNFKFLIGNFNKF